MNKIYRKGHTFMGLVSKAIGINTDTAKTNLFGKTVQANLVELDARTKNIADIELSTIAASSHNVGEYIQYPSGGKLQFAYVIEDIEVGNEIIPGINVENQSVGEVLSVLNHGVGGAYCRSINLGDSYTDELKEDIQSGKFLKAVVGGYLTINGHIYDFAHPDYWLHTGDTECTKHHMVVVPRTTLATGPMNNTNVTTGAYAGSLMRGSSGALKEAAAIIKADFGAENILTHRELFVNAVTNGVASNWAWYDSEIDLMNEVMVYGHEIWSSHYGYNTGIDKSQLKLFAERPDLITIRMSWSLRDVASSVHFAYVADNGNPNAYNAANSYGVRPAFAIC